MIPEFFQADKIRLAARPFELRNYIQYKMKDKPKPDAVASSPRGKQHTVNSMENIDDGPIKRTPTTSLIGPKPPEAALCGSSAHVTGKNYHMKL